MSHARPDNDVTQLLEQWSSGDDEALERLIPLVYDQLRLLAASHMQRERHHHTLQPTALIHETFLRLVRQNSVSWRSRRQFFAVAARSMRQVLVDYARERSTHKRGAAAVKVSLSQYGIDPVERLRSRHDTGSGAPASSADEADILCDVVAVDSVLAELAELDPELARIIELRFFAGFTIAETAAAMAISTATIKRGWATARAWLFDRLRTAP